MVQMTMVKSWSRAGQFLVQFTLARKTNGLEVDPSAVGLLILCYIFLCSQFELKLRGVF